MMEIFIYNKEQPRSLNYVRWRQMSYKERLYYKQKPLEEERAMRLFNAMYPDKGKIIDDDWSYDANGSPVENKNNEKD
tara:strand:- start:660 stop:893 length:234 start_codon:yes stop_codon:yes gene_type:complete